MSTRHKKALGTSALVVLAVLFVGLVILSNLLFRGWRLDLTESQLYTVSQGTKNILADIEEPINLYFYFSNRGTEGTEGFSFLRSYATRVQEMLEEFAVHAGGKLQLQVIDPLPFSEEEDAASRFGVQAIPVSATGETLYFGLAGTNSVDGEQVIPFFDPSKEVFLEYDVARLIYTLDNPSLPVIGLLSSLPMASGFDPMTQRMREPWAIMTQVEQLFEVRQLDPSVTDIDEDVDVLMVVHPKGLGDPALYAIDQFLLGGGRAMVFVDPHAEVETPPQDPANPTAALFADRSSDLGKLFDAWGIEFDAQSAVLDNVTALQVSAGPGQPRVRHLALLGLGEDNLDASDIVTGDLGSVNLAFVGSLTLSDDSTLTLQPLMSASTESMLTGTDQLRMLPDPAALLDGFAPDGNAHIIAARVQGPLSTAFPGGLAEPTPDADAPEDAAPGDAPAGHLEQSAEPVNLIIVADADLLADRMWVQVQNFLGQRILSTFANNGDFVINTLDNLTGSSDLISIRGRSTFARPFERVDELKRESDARFRETEQRLQDELRETERKLSELQSERQEGDNLFILTDEQRAEIEKFQDQKLRIRKDLRQVRRDLDRDIEALGTRLKAINIALVPALISLLALLAMLLRGRRKIGGAR